jgi:transcriptional regulator with XRE-family HTH domain
MADESAYKPDLIAVRLAQVIEASGLRQAQFARSIRISRQLLSQIVQGRRKLQPYQVELVCKAYKVSAQWLLTGEGHMTDVEPASHGPAGEVRTGSAGEALNVGKIIAEYDKARFTPEERRLLALFDALPKEERNQVLADLEAKSIKLAIESGRAPTVHEKGEPEC